MTITKIVGISIYSTKDAMKLHYFKGLYLLYMGSQRITYVKDHTSAMLDNQRIYISSTNPIMTIYADLQRLQRIIKTLVIAQYKTRLLQFE